MSRFPTLEYAKSLDLTVPKGAQNNKLDNSYAVG